MSSTRHESSSRNWWSLSSSSSSSSSRHSTSSTSTTKFDKVLRRPTPPEKPLRDPQKPSGVKFNTLASAIGFKTKKHPSLTIQDPPVSKQVDSSEPPRYANRPPSKSVSSTLRSSLEPRTPSDGPRDPLACRQSLLTLSDDPFASRGISSVPGMQDPTRLSVYSSFSVADVSSKKQEAVAVVTSEDNLSSVSLSNDYWSHRPITSPSDAPAYDDQTVRRKKPSDASLGRPGKDVAEGGRDNLAINRSKSAFVATSRLSSPDPISPSRPRMRARGMTDTEPRPKFIQHNAPSDFFSPLSPPPSPPPIRKPSRPRVIVRQASSSRVGLSGPPSAPPTHDLPPPPRRPVGDHSSVVLQEDVKVLSSGISFASSAHSYNEVPHPQQYRNTYRTSKENDHIPLYSTDVDRGSSSSARVDMASLTLKKAASHQSLSKRPDSKSTPTPSPEGPDKVPRKQRSFHHQWLPMPPMPTTTAAADTTVELRRGSTSGHSAMGRKRLFSGSSQRRPSTSQSNAADDDVRSVFSLPIQSDRVKAISLSNALTLSTTSTHSSFWDEGIVDSPTSPISSTRDYTPQQILSPAEMLRVEASLQEEQSHHDYSHARSRETSISASMSDTFLSDYSPGRGLSPPSSKHGTSERASILKPGRLRGLSTRSSTNAQELGSPYLDVQPLTSQSHMTPPSSPSITPSPSSPRQSMPVSLPPPPRPRPLPQPRPPSNFSTQPDRSSFVPIIPLSPPPFRRNLPPKPPGEVVGQRQSLIRKPSFLEIEDDTENNVDKASVDSFLDLNRESLDTVRSVEYSDDD